MTTPAHPATASNELTATTAASDQPQPLAEPARAIAALADAAEAVRTANHATIHAPDFDHGDLYRLTAELAQLTRRLPQLIDQTRRTLHALAERDAIDVDHGDLAMTVENWDRSMLSAAGNAESLTHRVTDAFNALSPVKAVALRPPRH